jgi:hypothetical protein
MKDDRAALSHVLWIGGGPQAGKTTLSRLLAGKYDLRIYNFDLHGPQGHSIGPGPAEAAFATLSMDERWALPSVAELVERSIRVWEERFARARFDLLALPSTRPIIAEGPGALPWCVAPLLSSPRHAIFLVPSAERREIVAADRWGRGQVERFPGIVDREGALRKVRERDWLTDELIVSACEQLGLRYERVDGSRGLDASLALLEEQFGSLLPETVNA